MSDSVAQPYLTCLAALRRAFENCGAEWALVGGLAAGLRGVPRYTKDVDALTTIEIGYDTGWSKSPNLCTMLRYGSRSARCLRESPGRLNENRRSRVVTEGMQRAPNRSMLRAVGFRDEDFSKPIIGIANAHSTITPCNMGIGKLAARAELAIREAGAMPQMFGTITIADGISMGTEGMKYSLVSREVIADSIETAVMGQSMDGVLAIGGCDKNMPGAMIAIARMDLPSIFVYGGTIKPG